MPKSEVWSAKFTKQLPLSAIHGAKLGIDAAHYLQNLPHEPLQAAIGGSPLALESYITNSLAEFQKAGVEVEFVFSGLDHGLKLDPFGPSARAAHENDKAFNLYEVGKADLAVKILDDIGAPNAATVSETFKKTLHKLGTEFFVAPYSALAQLASKYNHPDQFIEAIYGPEELFCFGVDKVITKFEFSTDFYRSCDIAKAKVPVHTPEHPQFYWLDRNVCLEGLGIPDQIFVDTLLLAGSSLLPTFPPLTNSDLYKSYSLRDVVQTISSSGGSVARLCKSHLDPAINEVYLDQYKRALTSIRYHVVIAASGEVAPLAKKDAPSDIHDVVGLHLPDELYHYISRGMLRPRVMNWLTSGTIYILAPVAGGDSRAYQDLVNVHLEPLRRQALSLLTEPLHRYYHMKEITTIIQFDGGNSRKFKMGDVLPSPKESPARWKVRSALLEEVKIEGSQPGSLSFAVLSLSNAKFAAKTVTQKSKADSKAGSEYKPLKSIEEVAANVVWRFLQLRGYIGEQHQLTNWGKVLESALLAAGPKRDFEEAVFIAVELLRFGYMNANTMFPNYAGAPLHGSDIDRRNCMLISRVACLSKVRHPAKGFSGPLSRHLLAFHSLISSTRETLRDVLEMNLAAMFLEAQVDRERTDWMPIALSLPFYDEVSCSAGVLTMNYLDDLAKFENPTSEETRKEVRERGDRPESWVPHGDFKGSLDDAFHLWDAVYKGVKTAEDNAKDGKLWDEANEWLSRRK